MTYDLIPTAAFALTTALAVWRWNVTSDKLKAARERITENETDLANFAEYKRIALAVKAAPKRTPKQPK